jgi:hypothetical protein
VGDAGSVEAGDGPGDEPDQRAAVVGGEQPQRVRGDRLVARRRHLRRGREVDPQLHGLEQATPAAELLGGELLVLDAAAGGHPLGLALGDDAAAASRVAVGKLAVEHVGDRLEPAVRMPLRAPGLAGAVEGGAGVIEEQERVGRRHRQRARESGTERGNPGVRLAVALRGHGADR